MTNDQDIQEIQLIVSRFLTEQEYVQRFVSFLDAKSAIGDSHITDISARLERAGLPSVQIDRRGTKWREPLSLEQLDQLLAQMHDLLPGLTRSIDQAHQHFSSLTEPERFEEIESQPQMGEWISFFLETLDVDSTQDAIDAARRDAVDHLARERDEMGHDTELLSSHDIDDAIKCALYILSARKVDDLEYLHQSFQDLELASRIAQPHTQINILRQGFLLLMTTFDAAVFDLVRVALKRHFFRLIGSFAKQDRLSLDSLSNYQDFESLRDSVIDTQLKSRYLKDLLFLLHKLAVPLGNSVAPDPFAKLIELVLRRNIHVHNRGIVDDRYLERDDEGKTRFNMFDLKLGTLATIDNSYWQEANTLCSSCLHNIARWITSRSFYEKS